MMLRKFFGAALVLALSSASSMAVTYPTFDGIFTFVAPPAGTQNCSGAGNAYPAVYRPQVNSAHPKTGLVVIEFRSGVGFTLPVDGQFNGANQDFIGVQLTNSATVQNKAGKFTITQVPATVLQTTQTVTLNGSFVPAVGCRYVFKATFLRRPGT
jgi:hypothetical protein